MTTPSPQLDGRIFFRRTSPFNPCICIKKDGEYVWKDIENLSTAVFLKYRQKIANGIKRLQENTSPRTKTKYIYEPSPDEYQLMTQLFNHLPNVKTKKRFLMEYSHTVLGKGLCANCGGLAIDKKFCVQRDCIGMCEGCNKWVHENCPVCNKKQVVTCPICQEEKDRDDVCILKNCRHPVCNNCFTKSAVANKLITRCPICRNEEIF